MPRPNVLIFCVDEMRADHLGCAGNPIVQTPHLDNLAARGVLFSRSYVNNPICMPARSTMFTGLLPRDHGVRVNGQALRQDLPTLPGVLAQAGYRTHAAGKLHLTPWVPMVEPPRPDLYPECLAYWRDGVIQIFPEPYYGFQTVDFVGGHVSYAYGEYIAWLKAQGGDPSLLTPERALEPPSGAPGCYKLALPQELHYNRYIADSSIRLIQECARSRQPFFAWCSFPDPHVPVAPPKPYCDLYDPRQIPLPARRVGEEADLPPYYAQVLAGKLRPNGTDNRPIPDAHWQEMIALTYGMVTHIDAEIGRVLAALDAAGLRENTIVLFLSDHGDMMGDHGLLWKGPYTFQGCIRIPTIVAAPGMAGGRISEALIAQMDLMPSLLDLCGVPMPGSDWAAKPTTFERGSVQPLAPYPGRSWREILEGKTERTRETVVIENDDPTMGFRVRCLVTERYRLTVYPGTPHGELFDLLADPHELYNLWNRPEAQGLQQELIARLLHDYSLETPYHPIPPWNS